MGLIRLSLALVVASDHFWLIVVSRNSLGSGGIDQFVGINAGWAVILFYVISGFLISYVLTHKYGAADTAQFYASRFSRIFSLYWPLLAFTLAAVDTPGSGFEWLLSLVVIGGDWQLAFGNYPFEANPYPNGLGQAWSLAAELMFYLLAPRLLRSLPLSVAAFAASVVIRALLEYRYGGFHPAWSYRFFPSMLCFFLLGHFAQISKPTSLPASFAMLALAYLFAQASLANYLFFYVCVVCFAAAVPAIFNATKDSRWMNLAGHISYAVYLSHILLLQPLVPEKWGVPPWPPLVLLALFLGTALIASAALYLLVERPLRDYLPGAVAKIVIRAPARRVEVESHPRADLVEAPGRGWSGDLKH